MTIAQLASRFWRVEGAPELFADHKTKEQLYRHIGQLNMSF